MSSLLPSSVTKQNKKVQLQTPTIKHSEYIIYIYISVESQCRVGFGPTIKIPPISEIVFSSFSEPKNGLKFETASIPALWFSVINPIDSPFY